MKKLFIVGLILLSLCTACAPSSTATDAVDNTSASGTGDTKPTDESSIDAEGSIDAADNAEEDVIEPVINPNSGFFGEFEEKYLLQIENYLLSLDIDNFIMRDDIEFLHQNGITADVRDIKKVDNDRFSFVLTFSNGSAMIEKELTASLRYAYTPEFLDELYNFTHYWGSISLMNNELIITSMNDIEIYLANTLEKNAFDPDFSQLYEYNALTTIAYDDHYECIYFNENSTGFINFDLQGNAINADIFNLYYNNHYLQGLNSDQYNSSMRHINVSMPKQFSKNSNLYYIRNFYERSEYYVQSPIIFNTDTKNVEQLSIMWESKLENGDNLMFFSLYGSDSYLINIYDSSADNSNNLKYSHKFKNDMIVIDFPFTEDFMTGEVTAPVIRFENEILEIVDNSPKATLIVDFKEGTESLVYDITADDIEPTEHSLYSADNRYSLHVANSYGIGDIWYDLIVAQDNVTNEIFVLDLSGGMYGDGSNYGFLENGDIYSTSTYKCKLFSAQDGFSERFNLADSLNLGYDSNTQTYNVLHGFVDNPIDDGYIIVYSNSKEEDLIISDSETIDANYNIGYISNDGKLIESIEIEQNVVFSYFGFSPVNVERNDSELIFSAYGGRVDIFRGKFDLITKTYTAQSE